jgi:hypothetical protein
MPCVLWVSKRNPTERIYKNVFHELRFGVP